MKQEELIELAHKYRMQEIEAEKNAKLEVENVRHEYELGIIRFKKASIEHTIGKR